MVFDPLEPYPVVDAIERVAFVKQAGHEVVVGEIGVKTLPTGKNAFPEKQAGKD